MAKTNNVKNNKPKKKVNTKRRKHQKMSKTKFWITILVLAIIGVLLIVSSYAWFSTALNVRVRNFNMVVTRNSGLSISFDAINYDSYVEISEQTLITDLGRTYPNNTSQWSNNGLTPVSSNGISSANSDRFDIFASGGVRYRTKKKENGYIYTVLTEEVEPSAWNNYLAFDLFFKNVTGSPVADNLYLDYGTEVIMDSDSGDEMQGLVNSIRIGFVRIGSLPLTATANELQNLTCNNNCQDIIFEPNSLAHTPLSIERALKYNIDLVDGVPFSTYAMINEGGPIYVKDSVSGSPNMDFNYFALQETRTEDDFGTPLFSIPDGVTKVRVYVWIEGQDIDSLETDSDGADISISINFVKDTLGYTSYN